MRSTVSVRLNASGGFLACALLSLIATAACETGGPALADGRTSFVVDAQVTADDAVMTSSDSQVTAVDAAATPADSAVTSIDATASASDASVVSSGDASVPGPDAAVTVGNPDARVATVDAPAAPIDSAAPDAQPIPPDAAPLCGGAGPSQFAGGTGSANNPFVIVTTGELQLVRSFPDCDYALGANIDLNGVAFAPIPKFTHTFDGANFTISNWSYTEAGSATSVGFFAEMDGTVKNLIIANATVVGTEAGSYNGIVAGFGSGLLDHIVVSGSVTSLDNQNNSTLGTGGIIGGGDAGLTLRFCSNQATVDAGSNNAGGGLLGSTNFEADISDSNSIGEVSGSSAGGLVGVLAIGTVVRSFATGTITGSGGLAGGLIAEGFYDGDATTNIITDSYSSADVTGGGYGGGLVGGAIGSLTCNTSYANGSVRSGGFVGGLVGRIFDVPDSVDNDCYWDVDTTGQATTSGGLGTVESDSAMLLQATYVGFDFTNVWKIGPDGYPTLS